MNNLSLDDLDWKAFLIGDIFDIENCKCSKVSWIGKGKVPYVGATNRNNGVMKFLKADNSLITKGNCIAFICDWEWSIGLSVYKKEDFIGSTTIKVGRSNNLNYYTGKFITTVADKNSSKYNFWFKRNSCHLKNEKILLPVNRDNNPDRWLMERFIMEKEEWIMLRYKQFITQKLDDLRKQDSFDLLDKDRKEFEIWELFNIKIWKNVDGNKVNKLWWNIAYITRKESNNWVDWFINYDRSKLNQEFPVITIWNETAEPYVQNYVFFTWTKVNILELKIKATKYTYMFIAQSLRKHKSKYSYSFTINSTRLKRQRILLPVNFSAVPDYEYMEKYMMKIELEKIQKYLEYKSLSDN